MKEDQLEVSFDDKGNVFMSRQTLDKILFIASNKLPEGDE